MVYCKYAVQPIDFFHGCQTLREYLRDLLQECNDMGIDPGAELEATIIELLQEARAFGDLWKGGIQDLRVFALPGKGETSSGFFWKQEGGRTFILSPHELPWLKDSAIVDMAEATRNDCRKCGFCKNSSL
jgi:hypothetical protein